AESRTTTAYCAWDTAGGQPRHTIAEAWWDDLTQFLVSPGARFLAAKSRRHKDEDGDVRLTVWDLVSGRQTLSLMRPGGDEFTYVGFSPDERFLAVEHWGHRRGEGYLEFWEPASGRARAKLAGDSMRPTFAPDGQSFAVYTHDEPGPYRLM